MNSLVEEIFLNGWTLKYNIVWSEKFYLEVKRKCYVTDVLFILEYQSEELFHNLIDHL